MDTAEQRDVVVPFIVRYRKGSPQVLIAMRAGKNEITTPGGKKEKGETHRQACAREVKEESGLRISPREFRPLSDEYGSEDRTNGFTYYPYLVYYKPKHGTPRRRERNFHSRWIWADLKALYHDIDHHVLFPFGLFYEFCVDQKDRLFRHGKRHHIL